MATAGIGAQPEGCPEQVGAALQEPQATGCIRPCVKVLHVNAPHRCTIRFSPESVRSAVGGRMVYHVSKLRKKSVPTSTRRCAPRSAISCVKRNEGPAMLTLTATAPLASRTAGTIEAQCWSAISVVNIGAEGPESPPGSLPLPPLEYRARRRLIEPKPFALTDHLAKGVRGQSCRIWRSGGRWRSTTSSGLRCRSCASMVLRRRFWIC